MPTDFRQYRDQLQRMTPSERFWFKVQKSDGCWLWLGCRNRAGYGMVKFNDTGTSTPAHRHAWILTYGPIPDGILACHHCDNPPCVRPDHLFLGTSSDNVRDAQQKGRMRIGIPRARPGLRRGERHFFAKLTEEKVRHIREAHSLGLANMVELAAVYGIDIANIYRIIHRISWKHVA